MDSLETLTIAVTQSVSGAIITAAGEIDMDTAPRLAQHLAEFGLVDVTLDVSEVTFVDSTGLRVLVVANRHAAEHCVTLTIHNVQPCVMRVIDIAGLGELFGIEQRTGD